MTKKKNNGTNVYVCGAMRNRPQFGFPLFRSVTEALRGVGYTVFSPHERDEEHGFDASELTGYEDLSELGFNLRDALSDDMVFITEKADCIAVLPGWENSSGARAEVATAQALGLSVYFWSDLITDGEPLDIAPWNPTDQKTFEQNLSETLEKLQPRSTPKYVWDHNTTPLLPWTPPNYFPGRGIEVWCGPEVDNRTHPGYGYQVGTN